MFTLLPLLWTFTVATTPDGLTASVAVAGRGLVADVRRRPRLRRACGGPRSRRCWCRASRRRSRSRWRSLRPTRWCASKVAGGRVAYAFVIAVLLIPLVALAGPIADQVISLDRFGSRLSLIPPALLITLPLSIWLFVTVFKRAPWSLGDAVRADGATRRQWFGRFVVPALGPGILIVTLLVFVVGCQDYVLGAALSTTDAPLPASLLMAARRPRHRLVGDDRRRRTAVGRAAGDAAPRGTAQDPPTSGKVIPMTSIELRNLTVAGPGDRPLLDDVSLTVPSGSTLAIVGPSGAGKSLLLRVLVGLDEQTSGEILLDDVDVTKANPRSRDLSMVFQDYALHPQLDAFDNLAFSSTLRREKSTKKFRRGTLDKVAITDRVNSVSEFLALTDLLELKPADLDDAQRQRVALGRSLVREAAAYLFDDPFSEQAPRVPAARPLGDGAVADRSGPYVDLHDLRHRRGADPRRPGRRAAPGIRAPGRHSARALRGAQGHVRRRVPRLAADEPRTGHAHRPAARHAARDDVPRRRAAQAHRRPRPRRRRHPTGGLPGVVEPARRDGDRQGRVHDPYRRRRVAGQHPARLPRL